MAGFGGRSRFDEIDQENRRLIGKPRAWIAELPKMRPHASDGTGVVAGLITIVDTLAQVLWSGAVIAAPILGVIAVGLLHTRTEAFALATIVVAIVFVAAIPFARGWASVLEGHPRRNAGVLVIGFAAAAMDASFGAFIAAHIDLAALWAPQ